MRTIKLTPKAARIRRRVMHKITRQHAIGVAQRLFVQKVLTEVLDEELGDE